MFVLFLSTHRIFFYPYSAVSLTTLSFSTKFMGFDFSILLPGFIKCMRYFLVVDARASVNALSVLAAPLKPF